MPSDLQRVAQQLLATLDEIPRVVAYLHDRAGKYRESAGWIGGMSNNPSARMAAVQLDEAAGRCEEAAHYLSLAQPKARGWVEQMVSGIRTAEPNGGSATRPQDSPGENPPHAARWPDEDSMKPGAQRSGKAAGAGDEPSPRDVPPMPIMSGDEVRRLAERLPVRKPGDKTRGVWRDKDGIEHDLISGRHEDDFHAAQRHAERLGLVRAPHGLSTAADVELKFAMRMRRENIKQAEIVINNYPCEGQLGCDELLDQFLPPGAILTVHGPAGFKQTYPKNPPE
ncbi:DddA-like double-stranded DNA deaminase toxin [Kribbella monticola]|uniref:DddA-like double-stranded DNA deaminase toxin n=1 Tax=Kribbella monticola TaxID=2185285 RepID=UPI000DD2D48B|nr:DddA-like double-stranded DNA deaminase toxin [Kribbella monticola]